MSKLLALLIFLLCDRSSITQLPLFKQTKALMPLLGIAKVLLGFGAD